jgi:hypothetical protein
MLEIDDFGPTSQAPKALAASANSGSAGGFGD